MVRLGTTRLRADGPVPLAALSPDGKILAIAALGATVHLVEPLTGKEIRSIRAPDGYYMDGLKFSPDSKILATEFEGLTTKPGGNISLWDVATGQKLGEIQRGSRDFRSRMVFSADGKVLAQASDNSTRSNEVHVWQSATGKELGRFKVSAKNHIDVALSADGKILAACGDNSPRFAVRRNQGQERGAIQRWEVATGKELTPIEVKGGVQKIAFSPDGKLLAAALVSKGIVQLLETATGKQRSQFAGSPTNATFLAFSPDGKVLAAGGFDGSVEGWDLSTGNALGLVPRPECRSSALAFAQDGRLLAWGIEGNTVCLWDARTGRLLTPRVGHQSDVTSVAFTPDARRLISGSADGQVCIWGMAAGKELHRFTLPEARAGHVVPRLRGDGFVSSPDGQYVASRFRFGPVLLWETATGKYALRLGGAI